MIICRAKINHYNKLIKDGWTDKYNNFKNKNIAFDLSANKKEIYFIPFYNELNFEKEFKNNRNIDIVELVNDKWLYTQKFENIVNDYVEVDWINIPILNKENIKKYNFKILKGI